MKNIQFYTLLITVVLLGSGCASITRGTMDTLQVNSDPAGANIEVTRKNAPLSKKEVKKNTLAAEGANEYGPLVETTPASFKLKREGEYKVVISKPGYETVTVDISNEMAGAGAAGLVGNAVVGGVIGVVIDASTGATKDLVPNPINVTLEEQ